MPYEKSTPSSPEANSGSPVQANLEALAALFPSVVRDGQIDVDALRQLCGEAVVKEDELFGLNWHGKAEARAAALTPSLGTLRPCKEESKDWDTTQNIYIEGDNLEVLKLLRKSYSGRVKMIYIDPPYNTGGEFVYPDNYQNGIENYKQLTGQEGKFSINAETSGRFHTNWLNMIYPRLVIARELMCDSGVIFISIDDSEQDNLKKICNELFGDNNFIAQVIWERAYSPINLMKHFSRSHDYILCYAKNIEQAICNGIPRSDTANERYSNPDNDPRGVWKPSDLSVGPAVEDNIYKILTPSGREVEPPAGRSWRLSAKAFAERLLDNRIWFGPDGNSVPSMKRFLTELRKTGITPMTIWKYTEVDHSQGATQKLAQLFDGQKYFDYPKPVELVKRCLSLYSDTNTITLDFFSGSATTAHAVMQLNAEDGGNRRFIMVQLPEPCDEKSAAAKAGYQNICEIGKERIRRAGEKVKTEAGLEGQKLDIGFRVYKLDSSNVKAWNPQPTDLVDAMESYGEHLVAGRTEDDFLTEILLKSGIDLTEEIETRNIAGHTVHSLGYGQYYACMDANLADDQEEVALGIAAWHDEEIKAAGGEQKDTCTVFVLDKAFGNPTPDDAAKLNFVALLDQHGIHNVKAL